MKVLLIATVQSHISQFHRPLAAMLHEHGCEVHVAARNNLAEKNGLKLDFVEKVYDVPFERSPFNRRNIKAYRQLKGIIDQGDYDVIHCNTPVGGIAGRLAARHARKKGTKVYYTAHGFHFYKGGPKKSWLIYYPIEKFMCRYTDKLITITKEDYRLAQTKFRVDACRIHGIGARSDKYRPYTQEVCSALRDELGYKEDDQLILCTGELNANKNQSTLIQAMVDVKKQCPHAKLLLAGNGPTHDALQSQINELKLTDSVELLGYHTDLEKYVNIADLIVSCSFREGLPLNIVEGMLCGKPVVASVNRGHKELITDGKNGILVRPDDTAGFAENIIKLFENPEEAAALCKNAAKRSQLYADTNVQKELLEIYYGKQEDQL